MTDHPRLPRLIPVSRLVVAVWLGALAACGASSPSDTPATTTNAESRYEQRTPTRGGTGKIYLDREISHVMGHLAAGWLERSSREREERTDLLIDALPLEADSVVADIGAGSGYFTFPVAERVPEGRVLAVDIQPEMLSIIEQRRALARADNVETVLGTETDPGLSPNSIDLAFIVDAYHEFSYPYEMGVALANALRPGGRLILIEYRSEDASVPIKRLHKMSEAQVKREMSEIGLTWERTDDFLPQQHFLVFKKPAD